MDMVWVYRNGHHITGVEFCEKPVQEFFEENKIDVVVENHEKYKSYRVNL